MFMKGTRGWSRVVWSKRARKFAVVAGGIIVVTAGLAYLDRRRRRRRSLSAKAAKTQRVSPGTGDTSEEGEGAPTSSGQDGAKSIDRVVSEAAPGPVIEEHDVSELDCPTLPEIATRNARAGTTKTTAAADSMDGVEAENASNSVSSSLEGFSCLVSTPTSIETDQLALVGMAAASASPMFAEFRETGGFVGQDEEVVMDDVTRPPLQHMSEKSEKENASEQEVTRAVDAPRRPPPGLPPPPGLQLPSGLSPSNKPPSPGFQLPSGLSPSHKSPPLGFQLPSGLSPLHKSPPPGFQLPSELSSSHKAPPPGFQLPSGSLPLLLSPPPGLWLPPGLPSPSCLAPPPGLSPPELLPQEETTPSPSAATDAESNMLEGGRFGFMRCLANLDGRTCVMGNYLGRGSSARVHELYMVDAARQEDVDVFTSGSGLVVKQLAEEPETNGRMEDVVKRIPPEVRLVLMALGMRRELRILQRIPFSCHPNVVQLISMSFENMCVVMPAARCDVQNLLEQKVELCAKTRGERMRLLAKGALGMYHLHSELGLTHGDAKPANLLVSNDFSVKVTDFGFAGVSGDDTVAGLTKKYGAPEAIAAFHRPGIDMLTSLHPAQDAYAFGLMVLQLLFVDEHPRLCHETLEEYGPIPDNGSFSNAADNVFVLREVFLKTGLPEDEERTKEALDVMHDLFDDYGAQWVRMSDLRKTILARGTYNEPGGLRFREEVELILLSLLNKNPTKRIDLGVLGRLLQCEVLWSEADSPADDALLPDDVLDILGDIRQRIFAPESSEAAAEGHWWTVAFFDVPWWDNPPPVTRLNDKLIVAPV